MLCFSTNQRRIQPIDVLAHLPLIWHEGCALSHNESAWHVRADAPLRVYPVSQPNVATEPKVVPLLRDTKPSVRVGIGPQSETKKINPFIYK